MEREEEGKTRKSKNKKINREGRRLLDFVEEKGWSILNGGTKENEEGEYTYTRNIGNTVIDYVLKEEKAKEKIRLEIGEEIDSDHHALEVYIRGEIKKGRREKGRKRREWREIWDEEGREEFRIKGEK